MLDAQEFEHNFVKHKSKIPKTYYHQAKIEISLEQKAMIFVLHYIGERKSQAKHVKQFLKKNSTFCSFAISLNRVLQLLIEKGILSTERRVKRSRVLNQIGPHANEVRIVERRMTFFKIQYDQGNEEHKRFLEMYQVIYPGEIFDI